MNYSKQYINEIAQKSGFLANNTEKVIRLLDVLKFIDEEFNRKYYQLILKGGTAINLIYTNLTRLSVDIDLDYVGSLEKEQTLKDRERILESLDNYMLKEGYSVSSKSRGSAILVSRTYAYINAYGNRDNIKVEINFIDRIHILPIVNRKINYFDKEVMINAPLEEELFAMKICALIDRSKPRDLYDTFRLKNDFLNLEKDKLRKLTVFYLSLDGIFELNENSFKGIEAVSQDSIKKELLPVLKKNEKFNLEAIKQEVINFLQDLLVLTSDETKYLENFSKGTFNPSLLFDGCSAERAAKHPMAKWRINNIGKK